MAQISPARSVLGMIVRHVKVDRSRTPQQMLDATGRKQFVDREVIATMPRGEGEEVDVFFFKPRKSAYDTDGSVSDDNLAGEYNFARLKPDPYAQGAVNEADPTFADEHPNGTYWNDADGDWCHVAYRRRSDSGRDVVVAYCGVAWGGHWWFAGVPE